MTLHIPNPAREEPRNEIGLSPVAGLVFSESPPLIRGPHQQGSSETKCAQTLKFTATRHPGIQE